MSNQGPFEEPEEPTDGPDGPEAEPGPEPGPKPGHNQSIPGSEPNKPFNWLNLRSSKPAVDPSSVSHELDLQAGPWAHVVCGLMKQTGADGPEAWTHYLLAFLLLLDDDLGLIPAEAKGQEPEPEPAKESGAPEDWGDLNG